MNVKLAYFFLAALPVTISLTFPSTYAEEPGQEYIRTEQREHQEFIFLLQYIGRDYQNAIVDGDVVNEFEYQEIIGFCQRVLELYLTFKQNMQQNLTLFQLQQLRQMVYEKTDRETIWDLTRTLIRDLTKELGLETYPGITPDMERGRRLYIAGGCAVCHGESGAGDGYAADELEPGPATFREPTGMHEAVPYQFFNAILLGVGGTSMPSYEQAFSSQNMWDMAFYLMTLRDDFDPRLINTGLEVSLEDLATKSDVELIAEAQESALSQTIDFLRMHPPKPPR